MSMDFFTNVIYSFMFLTIQVIIKKHPSRNINAQNFWLYIFGMLFNLVVICVQDFDAVMNKLVQNFFTSASLMSPVTVHDIDHSI